MEVVGEQAPVEAVREVAEEQSIAREAHLEQVASEVAWELAPEVGQEVVEEIAARSEAV